MIMELADETPHAYVPFLPAVKSSQPHFVAICLKYRIVSECYKCAWVQLGYIRTT